ncbi:MAG: hypothetical protein ACP5RS_02125 [Thermoplasmata archaeon]
MKSKMVMFLVALVIALAMALNLSYYITRNSSLSMLINSIMGIAVALILLVAILKYH